MSTRTVNVEEVSAQFAELVELVEQGEEVVIAKDNQPRAKLVALIRKTGQRMFGQHRGKAWMSPDFDEPVPDDFWFDGKP